MQVDNNLIEAKNLYEDLYRFAVRCFYDDKTIVLIDYLVTKAKEDDKNQDVNAIENELRIPKNTINQTLAKCSLAEKKKTSNKLKAQQLLKEQGQSTEKEAWTLNDNIVEDLRALLSSSAINKIKRERVSEEYLKCTNSSDKCRKEYKFDDDVILRQTRPYMCSESLCGKELKHMKRDESEKKSLQENLDKRKRVFAELERIIKEIETKNYDFPYIKKKIIETPANQNSEENNSGLGLPKTKLQDTTVERDFNLIIFIRPYFRERFKSDIKTKEIIDRILDRETNFELEKLKETRKDRTSEKIKRLKKILERRKKYRELHDNEYEEIYKKRKCFPVKKDR